MRKRIIAGNWKMNMTVLQTEEFMQKFAPLCSDAKCEVVLCVPFTDLKRMSELSYGTKIKVGAQNVSYADSGAYTGEINAEMLIEAGAEYVIIGHSERRAYFGETDETVNKRTLQALKWKLKPIVCVGETLTERENGFTEEVLTRQILQGLKNVKGDIIIAYEPVWAIGTGKTATPEIANDTINFIRKKVMPLAGDVPILYGGSMNALNAQSLLDMSEIDGGLIGGASLKPNDFSVIVHCK